MKQFQLITYNFAECLGKKQYLFKLKVSSFIHKIKLQTILAYDFAQVTAINFILPLVLKFECELEYTEYFERPNTHSLFNEQV